MSDKFNPYIAPIAIYKKNYSYTNPSYEQLIVSILGRRKLTTPELYRLFLQKLACVNARQDAAISTGQIFPKLLDALYQKKIIDIQPAIGRNQDGRLFCMRCLQADYIKSHDCAACKEECYVCADCAVYGEVRSCLAIVSTLYSSENYPATLSETHLKQAIYYRHQLTIEQAKASKMIKTEAAKEQSVLVWAVCGSGKTEMVFATIAEHHNVLLATPRKDVVLELLPRIIEAFPDKKVHAVYGGSTEKHIEADITIATTHQLLRYLDYSFSLVIIDEIDAFPYANDPLLQKHAHRVASKFIYMTATPDEQLLNLAKQKKLSLVTLFHRHHGQALPEPQFIRCQELTTNIIEKMFGLKLSFVFTKIIKQLPEQGTAMFFVATIKKGQQLLKLLAEVYPTKKITFVHAQDDKRAEKISKLRQNQYDWIITTTILERGVTIANSHVIVVDAEHRVFSKSTLVQIAGRVGRTLAYPSGQVIFLGKYMTKAIKQAQQNISHMNKKWKEHHDEQ